MAHVATHAAAEHKRREEAEEEQMAGYETDDLEGDWEFKIVRSTFGGFDKPAKLQALIDQEAVAGWQLLEKFDGHRLRFKRPTSARDQDQLLPPGIDPYRSNVGWGPDTVGLLVAALTASAVVLVAGLVAVGRQSAPGDLPEPYMLVAVIVVGLIGATLAVVKRRR